MVLFGLLNIGKCFSPAKDIPDLSGKVIFITGGNIGLGKETALQLSKHNPSHIYLSARSPEKGQAAIKDIQTAVPNAAITFIQCDLASLPSVSKAAKEFTSQSQRLDLLFLNAGVMAVPPALTEQGYELQFGTNHVGHALLAKLLMPTLLQTAEEKGADVRVISVSSIGHTGAPSSGISFPDLKTDQAGVSTWTRYGQSKLANILFAKELARRYPSITSVAVHPGLVATNLYETFDKTPVLGTANRLAKKVVFQSTASGARGQMWAAVAPLKQGEVVSGEYYTPIGVSGQGSKLSNDTQLAGKLWEWTEKELENYKIE